MDLVTQAQTVLERGAPERRRCSLADEPAQNRAMALAGDRELPPGPVEYTKAEHVYVAFGQRGTPEKLIDRTGGYPSEVVFVRYTVFEK